MKEETRNKILTTKYHEKTLNGSHRLTYKPKPFAKTKRPTGR
jgi:hypothetical protein